MCNRHPRNGSDWVQAVAFNPVNPDQLASASDDKSIKIWSLKDGQCQQTLQGHSAPVTQVEFLDDGTLVSCDSRGSTKFWDIATGTAKAEVPGQKFTFSKAASGTEQRAGRFLVTSEGDLVLVHQADGGEASDVNKVPVAFFLAPALSIPVSTVACVGEHIGIGCKSGAVIHLRAPWLVKA